MSYIALARKWRPRTFSELIGQEHINKVLVNSINQNRLHHAYLFTGTRGVGKTSVARILAKALNCEQSISATPCLTCDACVAIEQGRFIDLIEIDGASRTRVEDTRELLENVQYAPTSGRFKIYLIDEVHMLSQHSFNALLKTLEEPPAHIKFFLATTDPQKLPITVLSRCLQFTLKHVTPIVIRQHLEHILNNEQVPYEIDALDIIAAAARGSVRDALSLLDQAIAGCDSKLLVQDVKAILGYTQQDYALQLLQALANSEPQRLINISRQIAAEGGHFHYVVDEILNYLHQISISQSIPNTLSLLDVSKETLSMQSQFTPEDVQLFYQIGIKSTEDLHLAPTLAIGFEMMLLRMYTFKPLSHSTTPPLHYQQPQQIFLPTPTANIDLTTSLPPTHEDENLAVPLPTEANPPPPTLTSLEKSDDWSTMLPQLKLSGLALNAAENAELIDKAGAMVTLRVNKGHRSVFTTAVIGRIEQGLTNYYNETIKLKLHSEEDVTSSPAQKRKIAEVKEQDEASTALQNDPFFQRLQQEFSAELVKNSIAPLKDDL